MMVATPRPDWPLVWKTGLSVLKDFGRCTQSDIPDRKDTTVRRQIKQQSLLDLPTLLYGRKKGSLTFSKGKAGRQAGKSWFSDKDELAIGRRKRSEMRYKWIT